MSEIEHEIKLKNAKELEVTGIESVQSAVPSQILCNSVCGGLSIKGKGLHVEKFDVETKVLVATGNFEEIKYVPAKRPFLKRILK